MKSTRSKRTVKPVGTSEKKLQALEQLRQAKEAGTTGADILEDEEEDALVDLNADDYAAI